MPSIECFELKFHSHFVLPQMNQLDRPIADEETRILWRADTSPHPNAIDVPRSRISWRHPTNGVPSLLQLASAAYVPEEDRQGNNREFQHARDSRKNKLMMLFGSRRSRDQTWIRCATQCPAPSLVLERTLGEFPYWRTPQEMVCGPFEWRVVYDDGVCDTGFLAIIAFDRRQGDHVHQVLEAPMVVMCDMVMSFKNSHQFRDDEVRSDCYPVEANWVHGGLLKLQLGWWEIPASKIHGFLPLHVAHERDDEDEDRNPAFDLMMPDLNFLGQDENARLDSLRGESDVELITQIYNSWNLEHP